MKESPLANQTVGHYRIVSRIGAGGMGEVYLAEDVTLGRRVALKILPPGVTDDAERLRRFEQEARAASALNHPNIITIHEVGSHDGARFIATEFIEGRTLRDRLRERPMRLHEALDVAAQVASALAAAHQAGIIHRDIKPENVMLRPDGYVKVLDFGIVKLTEQFGESHGASDGFAATDGVQTEANVVMGSPGYMSPEQARAQKLDARTDIFSLGVMLYEMLAGHRPFEGETASDVIVAILERRPLPLTQVAPEASPRLEAIVYRALAKDRAARYQTAADFARDLRREKRRVDFAAGVEDSMMPEDTGGQTTAVMHAEDSFATRRLTAQGDELQTARATSSAEYLITGIRRHKVGAFVTMALVAAAVAAILLVLLRGGVRAVNSVAVLPFVNESADPEAEYLSDGIAESLINSLSEWPALKVTSRNSSFRYKGRDPDARSIGRELGVQAVLSGRISERGDTLQIRVELIDARDDTQIWGEQFTRPRADLIALQGDIARQVAERLQLRLAGEGRRAGRRAAANAEAYQAYLRGRFYWNKRTEEGIKKGIEFFNQAIELDPTYALAYAGLADCYAMLTEYASAPPVETYPKVKAAARKALEIDDTLAEAHTSLGAAYEYEWSWAEAEKEYRRAIEMNPNYATAHHWYAVFLGARLRHDEGIAEMRKALDVDPLSLIINTSLGRELYGARRYDEAVAQLRRTLDMDANFAEAHFHLAMVYEAKRMYAEAIAEFEKAAELFADPAMKVWEARAYALSGNRKEAERFINRESEAAKTRYVAPYPIATIYAAMGDNDRAMAYLEKVFDEHSYYVVWLNLDPVFDRLRSDPRFQDLLRRIGIAPT
ncbi:MAG TPA: protein kinase [Blastocatellia bacterium]|nr:protein kinase [Blastocatellia bacterium]